jgi:hypothetical protein
MTITRLFLLKIKVNDTLFSKKIVCKPLFYK